MQMIRKNMKNRMKEESIMKLMVIKRTNWKKETMTRINKKKKEKRNDKTNEEKENCNNSGERKRERRW